MSVYRKNVSAHIDHDALRETLGIYIRGDAAETIQHRYRYWIKERQKWRRGANMIVTPVSQSKKSPARIDYEEQVSRRQHNQMHVWDDSVHNRAVRGDLFAFVENSVKICPGSSEMTRGKIEVFKILDTSPPSVRLESWSLNVGQGDRRVLHLSRDPIYEGTMVNWRKMMKYKDNYKVQGTMQISHDKLETFLKIIK